MLGASKYHSDILRWVNSNLDMAINAKILKLMLSVLFQLASIQLFGCLVVLLLIKWPFFKNSQLFFKNLQRVYNLRVADLYLEFQIFFHMCKVSPCHWGSSYSLGFFTDPVLPSPSRQ